MKQTGGHFDSGCSLEDENGHPADLPLDAAARVHDNMADLRLRIRMLRQEADELERIKNSLSLLLPAHLRR